MFIHYPDVRPPNRDAAAVVPAFPRCRSYTPGSVRRSEAQATRIGRKPEVGGAREGRATGGRGRMCGCCFWRGPPCLRARAGLVEKARGNQRNRSRSPRCGALQAAKRHLKVENLFFVTFRNKKSCRGFAGLSTRL